MAANTYGRQVVVPLTNKSGGGVIAGDVVIVDTTNNDAFTTTTSAGFTGGVGIIQETIANNATGRVLTGGYAALVNVNASVTRGDFGKTHTVAKQATDAGSTRGAGTFCQFLTGGTTPDALVYPVDLLGSSLTNPMTTTGDMIYASDNSGTPTRRAIGTLGQSLMTSGGLPTWGSILLAETHYAAGTDTTILNSGTATSMTALDTTNLRLTFTALTTKVMIDISAMCQTTNTTDGMYWGLLDGGTTKDTAWCCRNTNIDRRTVSFYVSGLSAGTTYNYDWAYKMGTNATGGTVYSGPNYGRAIMRAWSVV